ncbi:cellulase family glycosylhydrolase [Bacillus sp. ISL-57]|uniref:cellulase family glycosylhydrolase n=1 Tax=Bacillus sp. ISL-57 TaxID=2819135 RepID=UPI001BEB453D|nr:cellulase family glycosylhydrolase [Bacillus sp. ISL-57]MBT2718167.1 cellulase family glycosylhydrolase [Bacillus sp. ISL-57]
MKFNKIMFIIVLVLIVVTTSLQSIKFIKKKHEPNIASQFKVVPSNLGIQTHIASAPVDVEAIKKNGFKIVRDDILWNRVEQKPNQYDFQGTGYDEYNERLINNGIRPYYILSYSNPLYEDHTSVITDTGREAYTKFVEQAAIRYKNQNVIWEIWNEPNTEKFWYPAFTSVDKYLDIVESGSRVIKENDPSGIIVAPALSDLNPSSLLWIEETFKKGLLNMVDVISVHPYRSSSPETVISDYAKLRKLIAKYSNKNILIFSGEWGYSTGPASYGIKLDQREQAQYIVRMYLINMYQNIPVSIWYDWKNDGEDLNNGEHNFGIREYDSSISKEASIAASTLIKTLTGYHFSRRINLDHIDDFLFEFTNEKNEMIYVYWTKGDEHSFSWPNKKKVKGQEISMLGENIKEVDTMNSYLWLSNSPAYLKVINE